MPPGRKHGSITRSRRIRAKDLKPVLVKIKGEFKKVGVPKVRLPTNDALISFLNEHLDEYLDWRKLRSWVADHAKTLR